MDLIRHLQHVVVGKPALCCVAVEQRWLRCPVQDQGEFPGDIAGIHERGVEALTAEWAGQVGSITHQEAPSVAQMGDLAPVHRERRNPAEITYAHVDAGPAIQQGTKFGFRGRFAPHIRMVAIDEDEHALVRQRR